MALEIALKDFAPQEITDVLDLPDAHIYLSSDTLCKLLTRATNKANKQHKIKAKLPPQSRKRRRSSTPAEELAPEEARFGLQEMVAEEVAEEEDPSYEGSSH